MEYSYTASKRTQNSIAVRTMERRLSPSRLFILPGKCSAFQGEDEHMHLQLCTVILIVPFFYVVPKVYIRCDPSASARSWHSSCAACMARIQYSWCLPFVVENYQNYIWAGTYPPPSVHPDPMSVDVLFPSANSPCELRWVCLCSDQALECICRSIGRAPPVGGDQSRNPQWRRSQGVTVQEVCILNLGNLLGDHPHHVMIPPNNVLRYCQLLHNCS